MDQDEIAALRERIIRQAQVDDEIRRGEVVLAFLDPVDSLAYAVQSAENLPETTVQGLRMIHRTFLEALQKLGLEAVPGIGTKFDPEIHEGVVAVDNADPLQDFMVAHVFSAGYRLGERLVRPAKVVIYRYRPA